MRAEVRWIGKRGFLAKSGSGHGLVVDVAPEAGGEGLGPSAMELLLLGLGACTAFDVVEILERMREPLAGLEVEVEAERADTPPRVFTRIRLRYRAHGAGLDRAKVERAVALSAEKYCSASVMLGKTAAIEREIVLADSP